MITKKNILLSIVSIVSIAAIFIGLLLVRKYQSIKSSAAANTSNVFIQPTQASVSATTVFQVWSTSGNPTGFVATEINFDKSLLKLTNEVDTSQSPLKRKAIVTSMANANSTGKITLVLGLDPTNVQTPANGTFLLATLNLAPNTQSPSVTTTISVNKTTSQVVGMDTSNFTITSANSSVIVNAVVSKVGDINGDGLVNIIDIGILLDNYNKSPITNILADVNHDGRVDILDIGIVVDNYGK